MVHLLQVLCPKRHCLYGIAYEEEVQTSEEAIEKARAVLDSGVLNKHCGICGSEDLKFEIGVTRWQTLKEAAPYLAEIQAANLATRAMIESRRN